MPDNIIQSRYELLKQVGTGGSSKVYLATDLTLNKNWAVKEIRKSDIISGQKVSNELIAEANLMKNLDHPSLPRIVDIIDEEDKYYIVMDYVEGETLKSVIKNNGPQKQEVVVSWAIEIASVLGYLHGLNPPIIYRDVKPANIILQPNGSLKIIDFGIARTYKEERIEDTMPLGTKGYAAPDQFGGQKGQSDARTDIYNLGVTIYELLTCHLPTEPPYELYPLKDIDTSLSTGLEKIILKCTKSNPDERYQTTDELISALLNYKKLDEEYVSKQKKKLREVKMPFAIGIIMVCISLIMLGINSIMISNEYEKLIADTGKSESRIENLKVAIKTEPKNPEAYELLIGEYTKDNQITSDESEQLMFIYNNYAASLNKSSDEFLDINFLYGKNYIASYEGDADTSIRSKVITALPFFTTIVESGDQEYEYYTLSMLCKDIGQFYETYILGEEEIISGEAKAEDYTELLSDISEMVDLISTYKDEENNQLKITAYKIMLNIIDLERANISMCVKKTELLKIVEEIEDGAEQIKTMNVKVIESKKELISACTSLKSKIEETYKSQAQKSVE